MDLRLKSHLDSVIDTDLGFMLPIDHTPGHPFLAAATARAVNTVRNRFAALNFNHALCAKPNLYLAHRQTTLYLIAPCTLGVVVNAAL